MTRHKPDFPATQTLPESLHEQWVNSRIYRGVQFWENLPESARPPRPIRCRSGESRGDFYRRYMRSRRWRYVKQIRGSSVCGLPQVCYCGEGDKLDVHHLTYDRLGHEYLEDLVFLCREHHDAVHRYWTRGEVGDLREATLFVGLDLYYGLNVAGVKADA